MTMYLVTFEDDDGMWLDDPNGFPSEQEARAYASNLTKPNAGFHHILWRCSEIEEL